MFFVPDNLFEITLASDDLKTVLIGICEIVKQQQDDIHFLRTEINRFTLKEDFEKAIHEKNMAQNSVSEKLNKEMSQIQNTINNIVNESAQMKSKYDASIQKTDQMFQNFVQNINSEIHVQLQHQAESTKIFEEKLNSLTANVQQIEKDVHFFNDFLTQIGVNNIESITTKLQNIEERLSTLTEDVSTSNAALTDLKNTQLLNTISLRNEFNQEMSSYYKTLEEIRSDVSLLPDLEELNLESGHIDITALVRSVNRNTRRVDGLNEQISQIRNECENITNSTTQMQQTLEQFNHCIYDNALDISDCRVHFISVFKVFQEFSQNILLRIETIGKIFLMISNAHSHFASSSSHALDNISKSFTMICNRPLPEMNTLDEVLIESNNIIEEIQNKTKIDDLEKLINLIKNSLNNISDQRLRITKPQTYSNYERKMPNFIQSSLVTQAIKSLPKEDLGVNNDNKNNTINRFALEELRVNLNLQENKINQFIENVLNDINEMNKKVDAKMESTTVDRMIMQMQNKITKIQKEINALIDNNKNINKNLSDEKNLNETNNTLLKKQTKAQIRELSPKAKLGNFTLKSNNLNTRPILKSEKLASTFATSPRNS